MERALRARRSAATLVCRPGASCNAHRHRVGRLHVLVTADDFFQFAALCPGRQLQAPCVMRLLRFAARRFRPGVALSCSRHPAPSAHAHGAGLALAGGHFSNCVVCTRAWRGRRCLHSGLELLKPAATAVYASKVLSHRCERCPCLAGGFDRPMPPPRQPTTQQAAQPIVCGGQLMPVARACSCAGLVRMKMVGVAGLEPAASTSRTLRASHLRYTPT
jgi:hypothetical protein